MNPFLRDHFAACIWGGAIGDAFGAPVERYAQATIVKKTRNPAGLTEVAAIAGNVLGAAWGMDAIPRDWTARIAQKDDIAALIDWATPKLGLS